MTARQVIMMIIMSVKDLDKDVVLYDISGIYNKEMVIKSIEGSDKEEPDNYYIFVEPVLNTYDNVKVKDLELSIRTHNILIKSNIKTVRDLCSITPSQLLLETECGKRSLDELRDVLAEIGLCFKNDSDRLIK